MDDRRFDDLAKVLSGRGNRRTALKGLLGIGGASIGATVLAGSTRAARRGYTGPLNPRTPTPPSACVPACPAGTCGMPDGCGNTCACAGFQSCIEGVCAAPCDPAQCNICIADGAFTGCFFQTTFTCSTNADCAAQFGASLCEPTMSGQSYCYVATRPV